MFNYNSISEYSSIVYYIQCNSFNKSILPTYCCCKRLWALAINLNKFMFAKPSTVSTESTMSSVNGKVLEFFTKIPKLEADGSNWVIYKDHFFLLPQLHPYYPILMEQVLNRLLPLDFRDLVRFQNCNKWYSTSIHWICLNGNLMRL